MWHQLSKRNMIVYKALDAWNFDPYKGLQLNPPKADPFKEQFRRMEGARSQFTIHSQNLDRISALFDWASPSIVGFMAVRRGGAAWRCRAVRCGVCSVAERCSAVWWCGMGGPCLGLSSRLGRGSVGELRRCSCVHCADVSRASGFAG